MGRMSGSYQKIDGKLILLHVTKPAEAAPAPAPKKSAEAISSQPVKKPSREKAAPKPFKED